MCHSSVVPGPQSLPTSPPVGALVRARGWPWRLGRADRAPGCVAWQVIPLRHGAPAIDVLLQPFDTLSRDVIARGWRHLSRASLRQYLARLDGAWPDQPLAALQTLKASPWPHQLALATALVEGRGTTLVLADAVGLGKTLTAAVALAELRVRGTGSHALVLVPAGLRDQWQQELHSRAGIAAEIVDANALAARRRRALSPELAWAAPGVFILSLDFAKQPTVTIGLLARVWDALVVDEAHLVSGDSARRAVVSELAARSRVVLLISATPHTGNPAHFRALMDMSQDDDVVWIRRDRQSVGIQATARTRRWRVACSGPELRLLRALARYASDVDRTGGPESRLMAVMLRKRALSSPQALRCTLRRRRLLLKGQGTSQLVLPLDGPAGETDAADMDDDVPLGVPGLADQAAEVERLEGLEALCESAAAEWRKATTLERLLRRTREPVILFTEYRDTLFALLERFETRASIAVLHGGLDRKARAAAVAAFTGGGSRILLATDAAAEGLNLQARCRLVVNMELPWSPLRLEQRAGRVDRIGQSRPVRIWTLTGRSGHEEMVVASLARRVAAIGSDLSPLRSPHSRQSSAGPLQPHANAAVIRAAEASCRLRALARMSADGSTRQQMSSAGWIWSRTRSTPPHIVVVFASPPSAAGDARQHVAVRVDLHALPDGTPARWLPAVAEAVAPTARAARQNSGPLRTTLRERERRLERRATATTAGGAGRWQPSFFDRRLARALEALTSERDRLREAHATRLEGLAASDNDVPFEAVLAIVSRR